tara:strand:- start:2076 stop:3032 length:957 start_codon:yes stop_codon:yes gene_type:complete
MSDYTEGSNVLLNLSSRGTVDQPVISQSGVLATADFATSVTSITVDGEDATEHYEIGDIVLNADNLKIGKVTGVTSTTISFGETTVRPVTNNLNLRKASNSKQWLTNRIALKAESISISSSKQVMAFPLPFSGIALGESQAVSIDMGMTTKTISMSGIITDQTIHKQFKDDTDVKSITMCAHEVSQLLHSYVDSSFMQDHQNFNSIIILIPTRVDRNWNYHSGYAGYATADTSDLPLMPFTFGVREKDTEGTIEMGRTIWPEVVDETATDTQPLTGFIRNFNTTFNAGQPYVDFSLDFEVAMSPMSELKEAFSTDDDA